MFGSMFGAGEDAAEAKTGEEKEAKHETTTQAQEGSPGVVGFWKDVILGVFGIESSG